MSAFNQDTWPKIDGCSDEMWSLRREIVQDYIIWLKEIAQSCPTPVAVRKYWPKFMLESEHRVNQWHSKVNQLFSDDDENRKGHDLVGQLDTFLGEVFLRGMGPR